MLQHSVFVSIGGSAGTMQFNAWQWHTQYDSHGRLQRLVACRSHSISVMFAVMFKATPCGRYSSKHAYDHNLTEACSAVVLLRILQSPAEVAARHLWEQLSYSSLTLRQAPSHGEGRSRRSMSVLSSRRHAVHNPSTSCAATAVAQGLRRASDIDAHLPVPTAHQSLDRTTGTRISY